jgi:hypothetical protein
MKEVNNMSFNPRPHLDDVKPEDKAVIPATPSLPPAVAANPKKEYYMEWWEIGSPSSDIRCGLFHTAKIKHFVRMFMAFKKYTIVFLMRQHDQNVLWDRRSR